MDKNWNEFEQNVLKEDGPVLAAFSAPWCGYCRRLSPVLERLETEWDGKVRVVKIDLDDNSGLAERYEVDTIPTLILFRQGKPVGSIVNPGSQDEIEQWMKRSGSAV